MTRRGLLLGLLCTAGGPAFAVWRPEYAQLYSPEEREWFRSQRNPQTGSLCCSEADGTYAEEDIRGNEYWTRFEFRRSAGAEPERTGWVKVPPECVIHNPNRHGAPTVWWYWNGEPGIRCYAPGAGL